MNSLQEQFSGVVDFLGVYISEAHANDEWPLGVKYCYNQPKIIKTRLEIANDFVRDFNFKISMLVDTMDNEFDSLFAAWPERFYIVEDGVLTLVGEPTNEFGFDRNSLHHEFILRSRGFQPKNTVSNGLGDCTDPAPPVA